MRCIFLAKFGLDNISSADWMLAMVGYTIVFVALILLTIIFKQVPNLLKIRLKSKLESEGKAEALKTGLQDMIGEETAAISAAIHLYFSEMHDEEETVLTIKRVSKQYSPWSSKIYSVTRGLNRRF